MIVACQWSRWHLLIHLPKLKGLWIGNWFFLTVFTFRTLIESWCILLPASFLEGLKCIQFAFLNRIKTKLSDPWLKAKAIRVDCPRACKSHIFNLHLWDVIYLKEWTEGFRLDDLLRLLIDMLLIFGILRSCNCAREAIRQVYSLISLRVGVCRVINLWIDVRFIIVLSLVFLMRL